MPQKRNKAADFGDILAALDQGAAGEAPAPARSARRAEPGTELGPEHEPRRKNPLRRLLGNISLPWPSGISGIFGGFGARPPAPYAEEAAEAKGAPPAEPVAGEAAKSEAAETGPPEAGTAKTEDEAIAEELGLSQDLAAVDLNRIRRDFAKKNHPDRFEPARRTSAARRMSIANMLIDEQMRQSRSPR